MVLYNAGNDRGIFYYVGGQWNASLFATSTGQTLIMLGSGDNVIYGDTVTGFWIGDEHYSDAPFRVSMAGALRATSAEITGTFYASAGTIGGFTIGASTLIAGYGATAVGMAPATYPFYAGSETPTVAPFRVSNAGAVVCENITANNGTIAGFTFDSSTIHCGSDTSFVGIDAGPYAFWAGAEVASSAPFRVTSGGVVTATSIQISNLLPGSEVDGTYMKIGTIAADKMIVTELSAICANLGTVTAGVLTAATVQTSGTPGVNRVIMDADGITGYDTALGQTFRLPTDGSAPTFSSGIIQSATIIDTTIISNDFKTSSEAPYIGLNDTGLYYLETTEVAKYGDGAEYGDGTLYGTGLSANIFNSSKPIISIEVERTLADIRLFNRPTSVPSGASVVGDLVCVDGTLRLCTTAATPGIYKTMATTEIEAAPDDVSVSGMQITLKAHANVAFGDVCYINSDGEAQLIDASAIATMSGIAMATASINANASGLFLLHGIARNDAWTWTVGGLVYGTITGTTGNTLSQAAPTATDEVIQILGVATHADRMYFAPSLSQVEHV